jgi:hypothetical protein
MLTDNCQNFQASHSYEKREKLLNERCISERRGIDQNLIDLVWCSISLRTRIWHALRNLKSKTNLDRTRPLSRFE